MESNLPADSAQPDKRPDKRDAARLAYAKRRVAAIKGFYIHLLIFALVLAGLFVINVAGGGQWWVLWIFFGWGIGVVAHAFGVFGHAPRAIADWEERKIKKLVDER